MRSSHRAPILFLSAFMLLLIGSATTASAEARPAVTPHSVDKPLIAYWTFDEDFGFQCADSSEAGLNAVPDRGNASGLARQPGVFGNAMGFSGRHWLAAPGAPALGTLDQITFSAWVLPKAFERYTEIFRKEDGGSRVLFAFQEHGTLLSLGLNIGGYVECDAKIAKEQVLDGHWHHCAGTFDGTFMRVYLDGKEIGALERPGKIAATGDAPSYIGSAHGSETFQGSMDDLRIYKAALTPDEVARLHTNGREAIASLADLVPADEPALDLAPLAHWTFNERGATTVIHDAAVEPATPTETPVLARGRGVHGNTLLLSGNHSVAVDMAEKLKGLSEITLTAWIKPRDLSGFREIYRQDCPERVLFSFQGSGAILALGLNADGHYAECDAQIGRERVLDAQWHHCAGTFDGKVMRVYLDGEEVGTLEHQGKLVLPENVPAFIGSSRGVSEFFDGALDDLRIYGTALTPAEIATLRTAGLQSLARFTEAQEKMIAAFYPAGRPFADTLAAARQGLNAGGASPSRELAECVVAKLNADFQEECGKYTEWTGAPPISYLTSDDAAGVDKHATRLMELLVEYKPLTEKQRLEQTPEQRAKWQEVEAIEKRYEALKAQGEAARFSPEWIRLVMDVGPQIQFRPYVREPVAAYRTPATPATHDLTPKEARTVQKRDWMYQADNNPTPERIRKEIAWTRAMAARIASDHPGKIQFTRELEALAKLEAAAQGLTAADEALYFKVRALKREIMFKNPVVDFDKVLFVDMPFPSGSEWPHETRHRLGYMAVPGARLLTLKGLSPAGSLTQLMPQAPLHGSFWRPDLSFDAKKVLFCFKPHNEKAFHLYEINVDGTGLVQLTDGKYDDIDPIYLPDGHILFCTTRGHTYVRCMPPTSAFPLARCDADGKNIYIISRANEPDYLPSVMDDGRVIYTRWEYTDKPLWRAQSLWTMHPDGTQVNTFWGNQSVWPDLLKDARAIPGSHRVMFTGSAHHQWFHGSVGIIDPQKGLNFPHGLTKVTADVAWPESGNGPVDPVESPDYHPSGHYKGYYSPYPLSEKDFIVSAQRGSKFVLYLMDVDGNRELIYEGAHNIFHALPVKPRTRPIVLKDQVAWPTPEERLTPQDGVIYSSNVYQGAPEVLRGKAKYLRILNIEHKTYTYWNHRPYLSTGPVVSGVQSEGVKRILGTVPIEADGSVSFKAPSGIPLHFQLLDENHRALQTMRSFTGIMPGESRGCLGCHERHSKAPLTPVRTAALTRPPQAITPPPWEDKSVSFARYVRPVINQYCGDCHQGEGKGRKTLDMTERPGKLGFDECYWLFTGNPSWGAAYKKPEKTPPGFGIAGMLMVEGYSTVDPAAYVTPPPMTKLSYTSPLIDIASSCKHHNVKVDPVSLRRLITWVDAMCPYRGTEEVRAIPDPNFQGIDWLAVRPVIQNAPTIVRPGPVDVVK